MNRRQRRTDAARDRKPRNRAEVIRLTYDYLANSADLTVTCGRLILPDGSTTYLSAEDAHMMHGQTKPGGRA